ncbi:MAG: HAD family hydrolase [Oscillospiraceae bacterium]|nr:HAD family hydrolase [Oscillospiraceae bacterium]
METTKKQKKIRAILFDKDGTLIDFNSIWIPLAFELTDKLLISCAIPKNREQAKITLLEQIGIRADGSVVPGSVYASGTQEDFVEILYHSAQKLEFDLPEYQSFLTDVRDQIRNYMVTHKNFIRPVPKAAETLAALVQRGLILGVSTSDSEDNTRVCLDQTGLLQYFSYIGCPSRRIQPKPAGDILHDFTDRFELTPEEVAIVGDTAVDIAFAKSNRAALAVGVLNGAGKTEELESQADLLLPEISSLIRNGSPVWD